MLSDQIRNQASLIAFLSGAEITRHCAVDFGGSYAVDAGDGGYDDDIVALEQRSSGGVAHAVDLFVYHRLLFDVGIRPRDIGFRLVIIVIADEILDCVFGKKSFEFPEKLRGERLVGGQLNRRTLSRFNNLGHRKGLAGACCPEQNLTLITVLQASDKFIDRCRLVPGRLEFRMHREFFSAFKLRPNSCRVTCRRNDVKIHQNGPKALQVSISLAYCSGVSEFMQRLFDPRFAVSIFIPRPEV